MRWVDVADKVNAIKNWMLPGQAQWLFETAKALPDNALILEIGGYLGHSTAALAFGCVGSHRHVACIDTFNGNESDFKPGVDFEGTHFLPRWHANMRELGIARYTTALVGSSSSYWKLWEKPLHFLFIDGSHQYHDVLGDLCHFSRHVVPCGVVAMHDISPEYPLPGPYRVWCEMSATLLENTWITCGTLGYGQRPC